MTRVVNAALINGTLYARVSPTRYRWVSRSHRGSFSNSRPGERECVHLDEPSARKLIRLADDGFEVIATGRTYRSRIDALGAATLHLVTGGR